jgi:putative phosphoesterase
MKALVKEGGAMRIAIIADLHGNLIALEAVLADLREGRVDQVVCLGDVAVGGPQPHEVVARLRVLGYPTVLGNTDAAAIRPFRLLTGADEERQRWQAIDTWGAAQLTVENRSFLHTLPLTLSLPLGDEAMLLCFHGSPHSNMDRITATTPETTLAVLLSGYSAAVMAGGHTHLPFVRRHGPSLFLNPGSVGLPYAGLDDAVQHPPWAEYGLVEWQAGRLGVELRRVPVDVDRVVHTVLGSGMPHADWLASTWR